MRYIGVIKSGDTSNSLETLDDKKSSIDRIIPGAGAGVSYLTGTIRNFSASYKMRVSFYLDNKEQQTVVLEPFNKLDVTNQPGDRIQITGTEGSENYALYDYYFRIVKSETEEEVMTLLANSRFSVDEISLNTHIEERTDVETTVIEGDTPDSIVEVVVSQYEEIAVKKIFCNVGGFDPLPDGWGVVITLEWQYLDDMFVYQDVGTFNLKNDAALELKLTDLNFVQGRDIHRPARFSMRVNPVNLTNSSKINATIHYSKLNSI